MAHRFSPDSRVQLTGAGKQLRPRMPARSGPDREPWAAREASLFRLMGETVRVTPAVWVPDGDEALRSPAGTAYSRAPTPHLQFLGEIARGGMGTIYRARDHALGRVVAVKVLHDAHLGQAELRQRFLEEARITGQLQHPGVVPVFETGELSDRRPYFTMKLITGQTLARLLAGRRADQGHAPPSDWLSVFEQVCRTLAYAHARGVIHRDLKPANIMVGAFGEVQLMDWGLAKVLPSRKRQGPEDANRREDAMVVRAEGSAGERTPTRPGIVLGTPAYMPPEQAQGEVEALDARSDVFGLGAILCEILTGQPPYTAPNAAGVLRRAAQADLEDAFARLDRCGADAGLVALARRCLARDPQRRPPDAGALVTELTACLRSVKERARQAGAARADAGGTLTARLDAARRRGATPVGNRLDHAGATAEYAAAFREAGLGVPGDDLETVAGRMRNSAVAGPVLTALEDWALATGDGPTRDWLLAVARRLDPGPWKDRFRDAAVWRDRAELERLARAVDVGAVAPSTLFALAVVLRRRRGDAVPFLLAAQGRYPDDFWLNFELACALHDCGRLEEAIGFYRAALALQPEASVVHANLGSAFYHRHRLDEAITAYEKAVTLCPPFAYAHGGLGRALYEKGRVDEALAEFRKVVALDPHSALARVNLSARERRD